MLAPADGEAEGISAVLHRGADGFGGGDCFAVHRQNFVADLKACGFGGVGAGIVIGHHGDAVIF